MNAIMKPARLSLEAYLAWEERQDVKHELVNGRPQMMAGAARVHNRVCANIVATLHTRLRGRPYQPFGSDMKFLSPTGNARYPDVQVDCAAGTNRDLHSQEPRVVIEVLSPSNDWLDVQRRLADYQAHPAVQHILLVSTQKAAAQIYSRGDNGWRELTLEQIEGGFDLAAIGVALAMSEIYEGVSFEEDQSA
jgi:Uma2 family endonuclease